ncbi:MAG: M42 family metallopeptidase [Anaerotruncus sp.]|jgi:putative aminopeptidase FrvX|nr:M42 family metallopeptidase [Anaerotruncus sp.]
MNTKEMVLALAGANGISGQEGAAVQIARHLLEQVGELETTPLGCVLCWVKRAAEGKPTILLNAHIDQIGMIVTCIDEKGFLRVSNCGGVDRSVLLAAQVVVHTASGPLEGVICTIPPHLSPDDKKVPKMEEICIDIGLDEAAAKQRVSLGDRVSVRMETGELLEGRISAPAIDDRAGCAAVILAAQRLAKMPVDCGVVVALTTMEEVGGQGARTIAQQIKPDYAFVVDVSFGRAPGVSEHKSGKLDGGPMLGIAPVLDNEMIAQLRRIAKEDLQMPLQIEVMGGSTGTDADEIAIAGAGVRCAMLSIPQRNMHTPVEVISLADIDVTVELMLAYILQLAKGSGEGRVSECCIRI